MNEEASKTKVIYVMGVSGCGKSTIGHMLSKALKLPFFDGDDFHPKKNIRKLSNGIPLTDEDRYNWLVKINKLAKDQLEENSCIIVCSALKKSYRDILEKEIQGQVEWVHLVGSFDQIFERLDKRENHFMPPELLKSQFDILEYSKEALEVNVSLSPEEIVQYIIKELKDKEINIKSEFGLLGLGVMGKSLCRNLANKGFRISMFNRHVEGIEENVALDFKNKHEELSISQPFDDLKGFVESIQEPRKIMLMVNAGKTVDIVINDLLPHLSTGDIIIDGGNSNYNKTKERFEYLKSKNIHFIGTGVSGGEEGALKGPSIMPSGDLSAYNEVRPFLESIAAKDDNNLPCCTYIGPEGSGHFVKMVHNGIEYAEMQLLAEVFGILTATGKDPDEIADILEGWKETANSYLLEITISILRKKEGGDWLVNKILDKAGNKGTGNWATIATAELGAPTTMIASALFARYVSFYKEDRVEANEVFRKNSSSIIDISSNDLLNTYHFARIINHFQGMKMIHQASETYGWNLNLSEIARIWTAGCIIKSDLMVELVEVLKSSASILKNDKIIQYIKSLKPSANKVVAECILNERPIPCLSEAINFLNSYTTAKSSANIIQAQRDYFGAHTYQRIDDDSGKYYHTNW
ncbi:NADP-dependent phosphogluconate dehydrogenase [Maribacter polysaccharolyticus]|uniref:NADP-dependent phosphogluconate dehydrogenase n=1 Tax=Maribacter polysaccharolyticus TaxID=3020831 RepID=UPI00237EEEEF|nr:NADP-dependent phosphogluconate dehydrogenase [Maribacter polysaccharolyticus]MDE3742814.1 NADP-dependent phosphogluconate dehydrogenase [Maribacter polysaccharolyticus]